MMLNTRIQISSACAEYCRLLLHLHQLISENDDAGEDGDAIRDAIRDAMDGVWDNMSAAEIHLVGKFSECLYAHYDRISAGGENSALQVNMERLDAFWASFQAGHYLVALSELEEIQSALEASKSAHFRGEIWGKLEIKDGALFFAREAARLNPGFSYYKWILVRRMADEMALYDEALAYMLSLPKEEVQRDPLLLVALGHCFLLRSRIRSGEDKKADCNSALESLDLAVRLAPTSDRNLYSICLMELADCHKELGDPRNAILVYSQIIREYPDLHQPYVLRGLMNLDGNPTLALEDFAIAVRQGSDSAIPYFYLAHQSIMGGEYKKCLELSHAALARLEMSFQGSIEMQADLTEWIAISLVGLGAPSHRINAYFQTACEMDPQDQKLKRNWAVYESLASSSLPSASPLKWEFPTVEEIRNEEMPLRGLVERSESMLVAV
ncbi:hypothetical protein HY256_09510 [Candidatus Sumerlaeota bacterium]|nr:hypothetical protein [Candidatus Sumerlaeota bacterium]